MLKEIVASNAAKLIAACVCPVATTAALTVTVPQVREAVHKATAPRAYAKPKTRVRKPAAPAQVAAAPLECPPENPVIMVNDRSIAPDFTLPAPFGGEEYAYNPPGGGPGGPGFPGIPGRPGGPGGPGIVVPPDTPPPPPPPPPPVPEPATWVQMLIGFGVIGGATRVTYRRERRQSSEA